MEKKKRSNERACQETATGETQSNPSCRLGRQRCLSLFLSLFFSLTQSSLPFFFVACTIPSSTLVTFCQLEDGDLLVNKCC